MGQEEIQKALENAPTPLLTREICVIIKCNQKEVSKDLSKMLKYKEVDFIELDKDISLKKFGCKHKLRLYFLNK
jgi:hypothetical protein